MIKWIQFLGAWLSVFGINAQNTLGLPLIRNFNKSDFKGGSQTWSIDQGKDNRIYFGNNEGLIVYDGVYWKIYSLPNKTIVRSVKAMDDETIFAGGQGDVGYFSPGNRGELVFTSLLEIVPERSRDFADIWNIESLNQSIFFRASDRIMLYQNGQVEIFPAPTEWVYMEKVGDKLFAQDKNRGLFFWSGRSWEFIESSSNPKIDIFHGAIPLGKDSILFVTYLNKNYVFSGKSLLPTKRISNFFDSEIISIKSLGENAFVVGTTGEGLKVINSKGEFIQHISKNEGLQDNSTLAIFVDRQGNIWTGLNNGISLVAYNYPIKFIKPNRNDDLTGYAARIFGNHLYMATNRGAFRTRISENISDLSFSKAPFDPIEKSYGTAYRFDEINKQLLMAHNDGAFVIKEEKAEKVSADPSWLFLAENKVYPSGRVFVGGYSGIKWLNYADGKFSATENLKGLKESFRFLVIDNERRVWASHPYRGIFKLNISSDSTQYNAALFTSENGLPSNLDNHVFRIKNRVIFATSRGIYEFNDKTLKFEPSAFFSPYFGKLPVRYLQEDEIGNIWFVTDKKIGYLAFDLGKVPGFQVTYFPEITGQILSGFENIFPYNAENIFISAERGLIQINLRKYFAQNENLQMIISSVHAIGKSDTLMFNGFGLSDFTSSKMNIPYKYNALHVEYSAPSFGFQDKIEYSYYLEGYDNGWSIWNHRAEKDYTKLPNGNFTFKVKARNNLGIETELASFSFSIMPPWYKSTLAKIFYLCLFVLGVYLLHYYNRRNFRLQKQKFEEKQEQLRVLHQLEIEKNEKEIIRLQNEKLANEVTYKNRELADTTMHLLEKSDAIIKVKEAITKLYKSNPSNQELKRANQLLNDIEKMESNWDKFAASFDEINNDFLKNLKLKFPSLTANDQKLCAYLQLNLSSKEIAQLLNISIRGVEISRYRLRKKLGIPTEKSIVDFLNEVVGG